MPHPPVSVESLGAVTSCLLGDVVRGLMGIGVVCPSHKLITSPILLLLEFPSANEHYSSSGQRFNVTLESMNCFTFQICLPNDFMCLLIYLLVCLLHSLGPGNHGLGQADQSVSPEILLSLPPQHHKYKCAPLCPVFDMGAGDRTHV